MHQTKTRLPDIAGIDLRSLAAFRIGLGLLVLWDQFIALTNVRVFYSDAGMLPRALLNEHFAESPWIWSLHTLSGSVAWQAVLMVVAMAAAVAVMLGWRARPALFIAWVLTCSLQARNPTLLYSGDVAIRLLCLWALFLPLDRCWAWRRTNTQGTFMSMASLALLLQLAFIYWFTAALKFGNEWTRDGTAVYNVLMNDQFVRWFGHDLLRYPGLCKALSFGSLWLEMFGPFVAFIPWRTAWFRVVVVATFWSFHLGLFLCLRLGPFPIIMMIAWLPFVPGLVWDRFIAKPLPLQQPRSIMAQIAAACCLGVALVWNLRTVDYDRWNPRLPNVLQSTAYALRLDQWWSMFSTSPTADGWLVLDAELADGSHVDLLRNARPVSYDKPQNLAGEAPDWKWHKLGFNLHFGPYRELRSRFGEDFARQWSQTQPPAKQVRTWTLTFMHEETLPNYMAVLPQRVELAKSQ